MRLGFLIIALWAINHTIVAQNTGIPAFPGAEGFGKYTSGGRGGKVYIVTNLNDSGPGSLREGVEAIGHRTIIFEVSGTISLKSRLNVGDGNLTIAGQSAPGDGITIKEFPFRVINRNNVIIRFMRFRLGDTAGLENDAFECIGSQNVIIDHCTFSWGTDETCSVYDVENATIQYSIISEGLNHSVHSKGPHGYGGLIGGEKLSYFRNLVAHFWIRMPSRTFMGTRNGTVDIRENTFYNWGFRATDNGANTTTNLSRNYYKPGPATYAHQHSATITKAFLNPTSREGNPDTYGKFYLEGNFMPTIDLSKDQWLGVRLESDDLTKAFIENTKNKDQTGKLIPFQVPSGIYANIKSAEDAFNEVLKSAGSSLVRDTIDKRLIEEVRNGTITYKGSKTNLPGIIDSQNDVGGWPQLKSHSAPKDTDRDGMPDEWELAMGLNPNLYNPNGYHLDEDYTNLEVYLNGLVAHLMPEDNRVPVHEISVNPQNLLLKIGESASLDHQVLPANATNKNVTWTSTNPTIATVSGDGTVKALQAGTCQVRVSSQDGGISAVCHLTVTVALPGTPILSNPSNGSELAIGKNTFSWQPSANAERYRVQISRDEQFSSTTYDVLNLPATSVELDIKNADSYFWRVSASNQAGTGPFSPPSRFKTVGIPNSPIQLAPANQSQDLPRSVLLSWSTVPNATSYRVQVATSRDFSQVIRDVSGLSTNQLQLDNLVEGIPYYWRVRASSVAGNSGYSAIWEFSTKKSVVAPPAPQLTSPSNAVEVPVKTVSLRWNTLNMADTYQIQISLSSNFSQQILVNQQGIKDSFFEFENLNFNTVYFWRVRARNGAGFGPYSTIRSFRTVSEPELPRANLRNPHNGEAIDSNSVKFVWMPVPKATSYTVYLSVDSLFRSTKSILRNISDTSVLYTDFELGKTYYWQVEAVGTKKTSVSDIWSFRVEKILDPQQFRKVSIDLYPNPAKDRIHLRFSEFVPYTTQIQLIDSRGALVTQLEYNDIGDPIQLDLSAWKLPAGKYFLRIIGELFIESKAVWIE